MKKRVGEKYISNQGEVIEIIDYKGQYECTIRFSSNPNFILEGVSYPNIRKGSVKNPFKVSVCGVGYFGSGKYVALYKRKPSIYYGAWVLMLQHANKNPKLKVCKSWHNYQNFAKWYEENKKEDFILKLLDGHNTYSPESCVFVPRIIHSLFRSYNREVGIIKTESGYKAKGKNKEYKHFKKIQEAREYLRTEKSKYAINLGLKYKDYLDDRVLKEILNYNGFGRLKS